ncbi:MAG TPA: hypothetical protein VMW80_02245 [Candidatus Dormibacteraeota bacterium]|nr:hypothetical protein [Candidatus Dormibacteraeota bacterium]
MAAELEVDYRLAWRPGHQESALEAAATIGGVVRVNVVVSFQHLNLRAGDGRPGHRGSQ